VLSIETFVTQAGLMVNEIAPRVHNSGHLTQDACACGQFEQHIRAISGWPLGSPDAHSDAVMTNLLGDDIHDWQKWAAQPNTSLHLYGKDKAKAGRKMGHVTQLKIKSS
jgi:5-(carboxyamino)imidazole ribonucleotide synthase